MNTPVVTAIVVTHNSDDVIGATLASARRSHDVGVLQCIVVDNASDDGTTALIRQQHPWVHLICSLENLGYGRGCNLGLKQAVGRYVLFMNADAVLETEGLLKLVEFLDHHPNAGLAAPSILRDAGDHQDAGKLPSPGAFLRAAAGLSPRQGARVPIRPGGEPFRVDWLCGAVLMARRQLLDELDGFDPRFFLYFEETDLCRRAAKRGAELWAVGASVARHAGNASARKVEPGLADGGCLAPHYYCSRLYYLVKHHGYLAALTVELGEVFLKAARDIARMVLRRPSRHELRDRLRGPVLSLPKRIQAHEG